MQKRLLAAFGKKVVADCLEKAKNMCKERCAISIEKQVMQPTAIGKIAKM